MKYIFFIQMLLSFHVLSGQEKSEIIQSIRDRYYYITGASVKLDKMIIGNLEFYLEDNILVFIKEYSDEGCYEYYYDINNGNIKEQYPYFIYFDSKVNESSDLRGYYNSDSDLILYKEGQTEIELSLYKRRDEEIYTKSINALNRYLNICYAALNRYSKKVDAYNKKIDELEKLKVTVTDTVKNNSDEYTIHYIVNYQNDNNSIIMQKEVTASDHNWTQKNTYYNEQGKFYIVEKSITTFQTSRIREIHTYYYLFKKIKEVTYDNYYIGIDLKEDKDAGYIFDFNKFEPLIRYFE